MPRKNQLADLGLAQLIATNYGEGLHNILTLYELHPERTDLPQMAYVGLLLSWEELTAEQRIDWSKTLAVRTSAVAAITSPLINYLRRYDALPEEQLVLKGKLRRRRRYIRSFR